MENVRLQKLHPLISGQDYRMEAMRQVIKGEHARQKDKMAQYAQNARERAARVRNLKHDFTIDAQIETAPDSVFTDVVSVLQDDRTGKVLHRVPTQATMELGRKARRQSVRRIIDLLV